MAVPYMVHSLNDMSLFGDELKQLYYLETVSYLYYLCICFNHKKLYQNYGNKRKLVTS